MEQLNRVAIAIDDWRELEARFEKKFPGTLDNNLPFQRDKLAYLENIQARYGRSANRDERLTLNILKDDQDKLQKLFYPNVLFRLLHLLAVIIGQRQIQQASRRVHLSDTNNLKAAVEKAGFGQIADQLGHHVRQGRNSFSIPVAYYVNEQERMAYEVSFAKDTTGRYQLEGYKALYQSSDAPQEKRSHNFLAADGKLPTAEQAQNLLAGRAVNTSAQNWLQLDLNDKDAQGNYQLKSFPAAYGYDLEASVMQLPLKDMTGQDKVNLLQQLKNGSQPEVVLVKGGKEKTVTVAANPHYKTVNLYDHARQKTSVAELFGSRQGQEKNIGKTISLAQVNARGKRNGIKG